MSTWQTKQGKAKRRGKRNSYLSSSHLVISCHSKLRFESPREAAEFAYLRDLHLRAYRCSYCAGWHNATCDKVTWERIEQFFQLAPPRESPPESEVTPEESSGPSPESE